MTAIETVEAAGAGKLPADDYWKARVLTALELVTCGHREAVYDTQYMSGTCSWTLPDGGERLVRPKDIG